MQPSPLTTAPPATRLVDSPWFWGLLFALMALVGLALIAPKFAKRQGQLERRYQGQTRAAIERERRRAGLAPVDLAADAREPAALADVAAPERMIPLWTLGIAAAAAAVGSGAMLYRERRRQASCGPGGANGDSMTAGGARPTPSPRNES